VVLRGKGRIPDGGAGLLKWLASYQELYSKPERRGLGVVVEVMLFLGGGGDACGKKVTYRSKKDSLRGGVKTEKKTKEWRMEEIDKGKQR